MKADARGRRFFQDRQAFEVVLVAGRPTVFSGCGQVERREVDLHCQVGRSLPRVAIGWIRVVDCAARNLQSPRIMSTQESVMHDILLNLEDALVLKNLVLYCKAASDASDGPKLDLHPRESH